MRTVLVHLIRLIILILFLPLMIIALGPLLVLAVFRGRQPMGPITLDTSRYDGLGRAGILLLGLVIWLVIWSGFAWLTLAAVSPPPTIIQLPATNPLSTLAASELAFTPTSPSLTQTPLLSDVATATPAPAETTTPTLIPLDTATASPLTPVPTATPADPGPAQTLTATAMVSSDEATAAGTATPEPEPTQTPTPSRTPPTPTPTLTPAATLIFAERLAAVQAVREANTILRNTIVLANENNLNNLDVVWRDKALTVIKRFVTELYDRYARPFTVRFEYLSPPLVTGQNSANQVAVTSREKWRYSGPTKTHEEAFEFIYQLNQQDGRWVIISYTYRSLKLPTATPGP